ncbi:universal stress protein [soil metagenome]
MEKSAENQPERDAAPAPENHSAGARIVVGIDNEEASQRAVDWALRRSRVVAADIRVVSVEEDFWEQPPAAEAVLTLTRERVTAALPDQEFTAVVLAGPIVETLLASSADADVIVLGSHRQHPLRSALAGSLPLRIAARATCVTVVVPQDWQPREGSIVVGIGDDESSAGALDWAVAEAARLDRPLEVVHAWQQPQTDLVNAAFLIDDDVLRDQHQAHLAAAVARAGAREPGVRIRSHLMRSDASDALSIRAGAAQLLVIGTHHRSPLVEWVVSGTAQSLLRELPLPVAIVPTLNPAN